MDELPMSSLGTRSYWEQVYENEYENFEDHGDEGEIWFGKSIMNRIIKWIREHVPLNVAILEIGFGNGLLLVNLAKHGFHSLYGIDYASKAIQFANAILEKCETRANIVYEQCDFLADQFDETSVVSHQYDVVIDKGTFDAICLNPDAERQQIMKKYYTNVVKCLKSNAYFVLTSCNWTKDDILNQIQTFNCDLKLYDEIETASITFGGVKGNQVVSLIFKHD